jgi:hypothetical protein
MYCGASPFFRRTPILNQELNPMEYEPQQPEGAVPPGQFGFLRALAVMRGSPAYPSVRGTVRFLQSFGGVIVMADIMGLPQTPAGFFGFHLHTGNCNPGIFPAGSGSGLPSLGGSTVRTA